MRNTNTTKEERKEHRREYLRQYQKEWRKRNPDKVAVYKMRYYSRLAAELTGKGEGREPDAKS